MTACTWHEDRRGRGPSGYGHAADSLSMSNGIYLESAWKKSQRSCFNKQPISSMMGRQGLFSVFVIAITVILVSCVEGVPLSSVNDDQSLAGHCTTVKDCSLNGECGANSRCVCDPAWSGHPNCDVLAVLPDDKLTGYHNRTEASWGGNVVYAEGQYHLFVAQMANHCTLHYWGTNSQIIRAVSSHPNGPFTYAQTVVTAFAHNPTVRRAPDGSFVVFFIGGNEATPVECNETETETDNKRDKRLGMIMDQQEIPIIPRGNHDTTTSATGAVRFGGIAVATAATVTGPWKITFPNVTNPSDDLYNGFTNPSPSFHNDGSGALTIAFQAHPRDPKHNWEMLGVATAPSVHGPYTLVTGKPIQDEALWCVAGRAEDPFLWRSKRGLHIIAHGMCPAGPLQAHYYFSDNDGVSWTTSPRQTYSYNVQWADNSSTLFARVERPQLVFMGGSEIPSTALGRTERSHVHIKRSSDMLSNDDPIPVYLMNGVCYGLGCLAQADMDRDVGMSVSDDSDSGDEYQVGMTFTLARPLKLP